MNGWAPIDIDWWNVIAATLPQPWPREAMLMDLRVWADAERMGRATRPGRLVLQRRWGCTQWQARDVLKAEAEWSDPSRPTSDQPRADQPPTNDLPGAVASTPAIAEKPTSVQPDANQTPTNARPTREVGSTPTPTPTPTPEISKRVKRERSPEDPQTPDEVEVWNAWGTFLGGGPPLRAARDGMRAVLAAGRPVADLYAVIIWCGTSTNKTAVWNRENGNHRGATPWRPANFDRYLDMARTSATVRDWRHVGQGMDDGPVRALECVERCGECVICKENAA